jgi:glycosyltransferase involved in cell wall biosynthesis
MNILFATFQGDVAGSTNSIAYLSTYLAKRGHKVILACRPESLIWSMLEDSQVKTVAMDFKTKFDLNAARKIRDIARAEEIDIINTQSGNDRYTVIWSRIFYGLKTIHVNTRRQRPQSDGGFLFNRFIAANTDKIVAVSHSIKTVLEKIGYPKDHVKVIHNGTPKEKYQNVDEGIIEKLKKNYGIDGAVPVIGSASRLKNHIQLISALDYLDRKVKLLLVGMEKNKEFSDIINKYRIPHEVHFTGPVSNSEALAYLSLFDINVQPSTNEGISQSILEAMAMGIPVIATNASGNPELIKDGENGRLFEDGDIEGLAELIAQLLDNPELRTKYSKAGLKTAFEEFSIEKTVDNYEKLYKSLLEN